MVIRERNLRRFFFFFFGERVFVCREKHPFLFMQSLSLSDQSVGASFLLFFFLNLATDCFPSMSTELFVEPWFVKESGVPRDEATRGAHETIFALGNGYIGLRGFLEESSTSDFVHSSTKRAVEISGSTIGLHSSRATYLANVYDERILPSETTLPYTFGSCTRECFIVPVIDALTVEIRVGGELVDTSVGKVLSHSRQLNMQTAELTRRFHWISPLNREVFVETQRFVSLADENIVGVRITVTVVSSPNAEVRITSHLQLPQENHLQVEERDSEVNNSECVSSLRARTANSYKNVTAATLERCKAYSINSADVPSWSDSASAALQALPRSVASVNGRPVSAETPAGLQSSFSLLNVHSNTAVVFEKFIAYGTEVDASDEDITDRMKDKATKAAQVGYDALLAQNSRELQNFWQTADIQISAKDPTVQGTLRFNTLHLRMSAPTRLPGRFPTRGLTGDLFGGRQSWETEVFILPFFIHAFPAAAKAMIQFRIDTLQTARERCLDLELRKGAVYPSRTINGGENSFSMPCALQLHVNADIAFAIERYFETTQDVDLIVKGAAEVVLATALVWIEWGSWDRNVFHLRNVTGPDEYNVLVADNYYTNLMAQRHMTFACELAEMLKSRFPKEWQNICDEYSIDETDLAKMRAAAQRMALPYDPSHRVHLQDDSFLRKKALRKGGHLSVQSCHPITVFRHQVCKSADVVLAGVLLSDHFTRDEKLANFHFYESLTTHDSSLTASSFSITASDLGLHEKAVDYFYRALNVDIKNLIGNTSGGIHAACMAGSWSCIVSGFAGMRIVKGTLHFNPTIPEGWDEYKFNVRYSAATVSVAVTRRLVVYTLVEGSKIRIVHAQGTRVHLTRGKPVPVKLIRDVRSFDFDAVVFDMDSIIHNVEDDHYEAWSLSLNPLFSRCGGEDEARSRPFTTEQYLAYIRHGPSGPNRKHSGLIKLLQMRGIELPVGDPSDPPSSQTIFGLVNLKLQNFREVVKQRGLRAKDGAVQLINELRQNGIAVGCVSASRNGAWLMNQAPQLQLIIDSFFDAVAADSFHLNWRPELDYFVHSAKKLGVTLQRTVLVLDGVDGFSKSSLQQFCFVASTCPNDGVMDASDLTKLTTDILDEAVCAISTPLGSAMGAETFFSPSSSALSSTV